MPRLVDELKRRNVYKVAVTYAAVAFVTLQAAKLVFPATTLAGLYDKLVLLAFVGFPIALVLAWALELTPEGVQWGGPATAGEDEGEGGPSLARSGAAVLFVVGLVASAALYAASVWLGSASDDGGSARTGYAAPHDLSQVTFSTQIEAYPAFSPDGERLLFSREVAGLRQLFLRELATAREVQLTDTGRDHIQPAWSPNDDVILFVRSRDAEKLEPANVFGRYSDGDVWRHELGSGREERILEDAYNPDFSPDGTRIAVDASWAGTRRIWTTDPFGRNPVQATTDVSESVAHVSPAWSPDGNLLAFQRIEKTKRGIHLQRLSAGESTPGGDYQPRWAPDGQRLVFFSSRAGNPDIWSADLRTGSLQQLTRDSALDVNPAVSPDGRHVAFQSDRGGRKEVWVMDADGRNQRVLTSTGVTDHYLLWSPDGRWVLFDRVERGGGDVWLLTPEDGD